MMYNLFSKKKHKDRDETLRCDNKTCQNTGYLQDAFDIAGKISYGADKEEVYCNAWCTIEAGTRNGERPEFAYDQRAHISLEKAQKLLAEGKLRQSRRSQVA